jgi:transcriptional regulator with GAF, ATPase, and Fis domain
MKKKYIQVSLYILIPFTFSAISLLWVIMTDNFVQYFMKTLRNQTWSFVMWVMTVFLFTYLIGLLITKILLKPVMALVKKAESLPAFSEQTESDDNAKGDVEHYAKVFDQIASVLSKVEAQEFFPGIVGNSRIMREIFAQVMKVAPTDSTVLIMGESGTGKELIASGVYEHSLRRGKPFVKINCVAIPESLLESELFGYEKGHLPAPLLRRSANLKWQTAALFFSMRLGT